VKHNQGFDGTASVAEMSVNLKIGVQRVGSISARNGFDLGYRARVSWFEHERRILKRTCFSFARLQVGAVMDA
jgi:hypothetical protein